MPSVIAEDIILFLRDIPPFQFLNEDDLRKVAENLTIEFYPKDSVILKQDAPASDSLRIIKKGGVTISVRTEQGEDIVIDHRGEGDTFGLISLMGQDRQKTTIVAIEDTLCFLLGREKILSLIESHPSFTEYFLQSHFSKYIERVYREMHSKGLFYGSSDHLLFTTPVGDIATKAVVTVLDGVTIREAAREMSKNCISSLIVTDRSGVPVGIVTDRDLREKTVAQGRSVSDPVRDIMSLPLIRIDAKDLCFDAVLKMIKHNIHHVLVIKEGSLSGIVTNHDLMKLQATSPLSFAQEVEGQATVDGLVTVSARLNRAVESLLKEGVRASNITRIMTELNDRVVCRVLEIAEKKFGKPPVPYCWIAFGSEGRKEQAFKTDQDNAIIYGDPAGASQAEAARKYFAAFTEFVRDSLVSCGFPPCRAGYMASNPQWCQPREAWKKYFFSWTAMPSADTIQRSLICFDFRFLHGEHDLAAQLQSYIQFSLTGQTAFFTLMASVALRNRPPLGFFRPLVIESESLHKDRLNLWTSGIAPIVDAVRLMALDKQLTETSTVERIGALQGKHAVIDRSADELLAAFEFLSLLRIRSQVVQVKEGLQPDNDIDMNGLSNWEKRMLRESFQVISRVQERISGHYRGGFIGA